MRIIRGVVFVGLAFTALIGNPYNVEACQKHAPKSVQIAYYDYLGQYGVSNPDDPRNCYDYWRAFRAGYIPQLWDDLSEDDKNEDIEQASAGLREEGVTRESFVGHYMWSDKYKLPCHPVQPK